MKLTEEQREIALRVAKDAFNTESHRAWSYEGGDANVLDFAARFLAALPKPKPEPVGKVDHGRYRDTKWLRQPPPSRTLLYTEAPIAPPASEQKPMAWATTNEDGDYAMLFFDKQEARSYSGDDEPIGLAPVSSSAPQPDYKAQRDALLEALEKSVVIIDGAIYCGHELNKNGEDMLVGIRAAIASVKGGA